MDGVNAVQAHTPDSITILGTTWRQSVLVPSRGQVLTWDCRSFDELEAEHFETILALEPELVIFGSGRKLRFPAPALCRALIQQRVGIESMDTGAACRTYNILVSEGRRVVGAFLIESDRGPGHL
ncbi:uncharacterized protein C7444_103305 [Sphaerotilus hippei]|uniref:Mth938-like domain-containing protein n=2 Tax=Sphaerotilus hippei TaxID=744406 RepID=A0A318H3R6_9BURK|nr:uncharacterized protein C7444_103305 [Sphaerotilus hippei]